MTVQRFTDRVVFVYRDGMRWMDCPRDLAILMLQTTDRGGRIVDAIRASQYIHQLGRAPSVPV